MKREAPSKDLAQCLAQRTGLINVLLTMFGFYLKSKRSDRKVNRG